MVFGWGISDMLPQPLFFGDSMTDIVDKLSKYVAGMGTRNPKDYSAFLSVDEANEAIQQIKNLRNALRYIAYDYVELSYEKVLWQRDMHIKDARKALEESYKSSENNKKPLSPFDNNF